MFDLYLATYNTTANSVNNVSITECKIIVSCAHGHPRDWSLLWLATYYYYLMEIKEISNNVS